MRPVQEHRDVVAGVIALLGVLLAGVLYVRAPQPTAEDERLEDSKQYLRQMEVYGGDANVLASEFRVWFGGLWHGRSLAYTVAVIGLLVAAAAWLVLTPLPPLPPEEEAGGHPPAGGPTSP